MKKQHGDCPILKMSVNGASIILVLYIRYLDSDLLTVIHNQLIGSLYRQNTKWHGHCPILEMSVKPASNQPEQFLVVHVG